MTRALVIVVALVACGDDPDRVLVFSRTNGFRHDDAISAARVGLPGAVPEVELELSEDPAAFTDLDRYRAVVFLYTSGNDVLDDAGKSAFESFVRSGGGWLGIHSAADTEYLWPFYQRLVVVHFQDHPPIQSAVVHLEQPSHPVVQGRSFQPWPSTDEWYNFDANPRATSGVTVLATVDETTYTGGTMGVDHPVIWCHENLGGRALYIELGHSAGRWGEPELVDLVSSSLRWVSSLEP